MAGAYHATELFWISDKSENKLETWRFLNQSLIDSESVRSRLQTTVSRSAHLADAVLSTAKTVLHASRNIY